MHTPFPSRGISASRLLPSGALAVILPFVGLAGGALASAQTYEGYGNISVGGSGGSVYHVTSLANSGAGTLRDGVVNRSGPRTIVFDVGGTITLTSTIDISAPFLTIDGGTAPSPGITLDMSTSAVGMVIHGTHDIILRHLRLTGPWVPPDGPEVGPHLTIDGDSGPDQVAQRIILDHLTLQGGSDGAPDIWGEVRDVTVSWCLIYGNLHPTSLSHYPSPFQVRQRISLHHNVWAKNLERNPQVRADVRALDHVNNITYSWGFGGSFGYGMRIRSDAGEPKVNANIVNNAFLAGSINPGWGLVYGDEPGADSSDGGPSGATRPQGTVVTGTNLGNLWVAGNILPASNEDQYSTISAPLTVPVASQVTTWPAAELGIRVLPTVGTQHRITAEQQLIDEIAARFGSTPPQPSLSIGDVSVSEGNSGTRTATFTVSLSPASASPVSVTWATANGTATAGSDYAASNGTLTIPAGATSGTLNVTVNGDTTAEPNETFLVNLSAPVNATLVDAQAVGTITNDDAAPPLPTLAITDTSLSEGNTGASLMTFTVSLSAASASAVRVNYATANGTAAAGTDYTSASGVLNLPAGATAASVTVSVTGDSVYEPDETVLVNLSSPVNATLGDAQAVGTIRNDDAQGLSIGDVRVVEPRSGTRNAVFTVTLAPASSTVVTVAYATANGTASAPADFTAKTGTLSFPAGTTSQTIAVVLAADALLERKETFTVNLSSATGGAVIAKAQGTATVFDRGNLFTVTPCRLVDTRNAAGPLAGPALAANAARSFALTGACGIPATASAVTGTVTVTSAAAAGNLRVFPPDVAMPLASTINYRPGQTRANSGTFPLSATGQLAIRVDQASGSVHTILDVTGYME